MTRLPELIAAGLLGVGVAAAVAPRLAARAFGVVTDDPGAVVFIRCTGARDAILGALILAQRGDRAALRRTLAWSAPLGLTDAFAVAAAFGVRPQLVVHVGGAVVLAAAARRLGS